MKDEIFYYMEHELYIERNSKEKESQSKDRSTQSFIGFKNKETAEKINRK